MGHENHDYLQVLRSRGYRVTPQRLIVLDAVCELEGHATIPDIREKVHDMDPTIDLSTIYRALDVLCGVGLVVESEIGDEGKVYKITGDSDHQHLVCKHCGIVITVDNSAFFPLLDELRQTYGFEVNVDHLTLTGTCATCSVD